MLVVGASGWWEGGRRQRRRSCGGLKEAGHTRLLTRLNTYCARTWDGNENAAMACPSLCKEGFGRSSYSVCATIA